MFHPLSLAYILSSLIDRFFLKFFERHLTVLVGVDTSQKLVHVRLGNRDLELMLKVRGKLYASDECGGVDGVCLSCGIFH